MLTLSPTTGLCLWSWEVREKGGPSCDGLGCGLLVLTSVLAPIAMGEAGYKSRLNLWTGEEEPSCQCSPVQCANP